MSLHFKITLVLSFAKVFFFNLLFLHTAWWSFLVTHLVKTFSMIILAILGKNFVLLDANVINNFRRMNWTTFIIVQGANSQNDHLQLQMPGGLALIPQSPTPPFFCTYYFLFTTWLRLGMTSFSLVSLHSYNVYIPRIST